MRITFTKHLDSGGTNNPTGANAEDQTMKTSELNTVLGLGQRYINNIDLGCIYKVAVLTKKGCYTYQVRNNQRKLKKNDIETFARDLAFECLENWNNDYYFNVKDAYQSLKDDEAIIMIYGSACGDIDHFYKGTKDEIIKVVNEDFDIQ